MILITADLHLNDLPRDEYRHDWISKILPALLKKHKAKLLVILGDLSDEKDHLSSWLVNTTVDHLLALVKVCPVVIDTGNHDYVEADNPFYEFVGNYAGISWVTKPTEAAQLVNTGQRRDLLGNALFLPHTHNYKRDWKGLDFKKYDCIFTHQTYQGVQVGPRKLEGIPLDVFPRGCMVISGDIHVPQRVGPVVYAGAPYLCNFGDQYEPRVLLLEEGQIRSIPSPGPQKRLVEFTYPNRRTERPWTDYFKCRANPGDILKIRIHLEPSQAPDWKTIKQEVTTWADENGYLPYLIQPHIDAQGTKSMSKRKVGSKTDEQLIQDYVGARAVSEATLRTGLNLLRKA